MKMVLNFVIKHEFWFSMLVIIGLYIGEYKMGEMWMGQIATLVFFIAGGRLISHPMWKKDRE